jgi:hypothetical protein
MSLCCESGGNQDQALSEQETSEEDDPGVMLGKELLQGSARELPTDHQALDLVGALDDL